MTKEDLPKDGEPVLHRASCFLGAISQGETIHHRDGDGSHGTGHVRMLAGHRQECMRACVRLRLLSIPLAQD